jgi:hypothetical protein
MLWRINFVHCVLMLFMNTISEAIITRLIITARMHSHAERGKEAKQQAYSKHLADPAFFIVCQKS